MVVLIRLNQTTKTLSFIPQPARHVQGTHKELLAIPNGVYASLAKQHDEK
jgi:hypothetical protein